TTVLSLTSMPIELSRSVSHSEFVSRRNGVNISEPMAIISALSIRFCRANGLLITLLTTLFTIFPHRNTRHQSDSVQPQTVRRRRIEYRLQPAALGIPSAAG